MKELFLGRLRRLGPFLQGAKCSSPSPDALGLRAYRGLTSAASYRGYRDLAPGIRSRATSATDRGRWMSTGPPSYIDPNEHYGILTSHGWHYIKKKYYADKWTIPGINKLIQERFPGEDAAFDDIQQLVEEWCESVKLSDKPKPTKITREIQKEIDEKRLYQHQAKPMLREEAKERKLLAKAKAKMEREAARQRKEEAKQSAIEYIMKHGKVPPDYDFDGFLTMTNVWNHFASRFYDQRASEPSPAKLWLELPQEKKLEYREELVDLMKRGLSYHRGQLVPLRTKYGPKYDYMKRRRQRTAPAGPGPTEPIEPASPTEPASPEAI